MGPRIRRLIAIIILLTMQFLRTFGIIGYDCGSSSANLTTLSLLNIEECDISQKQVNSSSIYVQLLQINDFKSTRHTMQS